jgi:hypothetical protein
MPKIDQEGSKMNDKQLRIEINKIVLLYSSKFSSLEEMKQTLEQEISTLMAQEMGIQEEPKPQKPQVQGQMPIPESAYREVKIIDGEEHEIAPKNPIRTEVDPPSDGVEGIRIENGLEYGDLSERVK